MTGFLDDLISKHNKTPDSPMLKQDNMPALTQTKGKAKNITSSNFEQLN
jgi:hypothetical protein